MSKDRKKLLHIHSSVNDKQPTPATLELGELGVNNAKGNAFISTKNSDGEVVRFSEDETVIGWMEQKEVFPYEGYMRGADNSQVDGVTEQDLLDNKSNLIIKLNQVVPENTDYSPYDEKVNGAKDIYGNLINPISSGGYKDGAGLAIDMSKYAMIGANPSFSSITTTCHATLNGTTEIKGKGDGCGSKFTVEVANACIDASDTLNEYGVNHSNFGTSCDGTKISNDTTLKGKKVFIDSPSGNLTVDIQACNHISGRTNDFVIRECQDNGGKVEIDTTDIDVSASTTDIKSCDRISAVTDNFIIEQCSSGKTHIHSCAGITLESKNITLTDGNCGSGQTTIEVNDLCLVGERKINVYGDETNVGLDCDDSKIATNARVFGKGTLITTKATPTTYAGENNVETVAAQDIKENADRDINETAGRNINETATGNINESTTNGNINESAKNINNTASNDICDTAANNATFYGAVKTNVGINCNDTATAATTTVKGGKVIVDASTTDLGLTAKQDILESAERDITITAGDNICETAGDEATFYGVNLTRLGITCDGTTKTTQLELGGEGVCVDASDRASMYGANKSDLGINCAENDRSTLTRVSGDTVNEGGNIVNTNAETSINETAPVINETATTSINEKAPTITESGSTISGYATTQIVEKAPQIIESASISISNTAPTLNYSGNTTNISGNTLVNINANGNGGDVAVHAKDDITVHADDLLCESGKTVTIFAGEGGKLTIGGNSCDGNNRGTYPITYVRRPKTGTCDIHATTVDDALDEVYDRSRISLTSTAHTDSSTGSNYSYTEYTLHQDTGTCDVAIPFTVKETIVAMSAETYPATSELLKKYTLWQYIGNERKEIGEINIPKDHILKDVSIVNGHLNGNTFTPCPDGDTTCSWYIKLVWNVFDPSTGHADDKITYLPADDFVQDYEFHDSQAIDFTQWYDGKKNHVSANTTVVIKNADGTGTKTFSKSNGTHTLSAYTLNSVSGDVKTAKAATNWTYDPFNKKVTITAATDASHINRKTVSWTYGDVKSAAGASYDPGDGTVNTFGNTRTMSFVIPQSVDNINRGTLKVTHNGFTNTYDPASASTWTLPHSSLTAIYEATSGKSGSVVFNTSADKSISIPTCVNHLNRHTIKFQSGSTSSFNNQTYDPGKDCANSAETINIPTAVSHLNRGKFTVKHCNQEVTFDPSTNTSITMSHSTLSYTHNGFTGTYDPCTGGTFTAPHSSLTINYGVTCSSSEAVNKTYDTSAAKTIVIPKTISDITGGAVKLNECSGNCITVTGDICASGVIKATALYSTSDKNLKENIKAIPYEDYHKVSNINLKSFNFKDDETKKTTYGVIAQDLQAVGLDNIVHKDENNNLSVDYTSLLILKIADLENTIKNLSEEIKNLKGENKK